MTAVITTNMTAVSMVYWLKRPFTWQIDHCYYGFRLQCSVKPRTLTAAAEANQAEVPNAHPGEQPEKRSKTYEEQTQLILRAR